MLLFREQIPWLNDTRNLYPPLSCLQGTKLPVKYSHNYISFFFIAYFGPAFRHGTLPSIRGVVSGTMFSHHLGKPSKKRVFYGQADHNGWGVNPYGQGVVIFSKLLNHFSFLSKARNIIGDIFTERLWISLTAVF